MPIESRATAARERPLFAVSRAEPLVELVGISKIFPGEDLKTIGSVAGLFSLRVLGSAVSSFGPDDGVTSVLVTALLMLVSLSACLIPESARFGLTRWNAGQLGIPRPPA